MERSSLANISSASALGANVIGIAERRLLLTLSTPLKDAVPTGLVSLAREVLKLPTGGLKSVTDSYVDVVVRIRNVGIAVDDDIGAAGNRKMNPYLVESPL